MSYNHSPELTVQTMPESATVPDRVHMHDRLILPVGTQVVALSDVLARNGRVLHPRGSVGVIVRAPADATHSYRVRFPDDVEYSLAREELVVLAQYKEGPIGDAQSYPDGGHLYDR